jgi:hypothetical protein
MTRARAAALGVELVALPTWYDVDDAVTLARLAVEVPILFRRQLL